MLFVIISIFVFYNSVKGQATNLSDMISVVGHKSLSQSEKVKVKVKGNEKLSVIQNNKDKNGDLFQIENVLVLINVQKGTLEQDRLEKARINFKSDSQLVKIPYDISEIISLNNFKYVQASYEYPDDPVRYVLFYAVNNNHTMALSGAAEFPKSDRKHGECVLSAFLKTMKFK